MSHGSHMLLPKLKNRVNMLFGSPGEQVPLVYFPVIVFDDVYDRFNAPFLSHYRFFNQSCLK